MPHIARPALPPVDRIDLFWSHVDRTAGPGECWAWNAYVHPNGYGKFMVGRIPRMAHRVAFEIARGPIQVGLFLDHLCRNRRCVNPAHLEPVTQAENNRRSESGHAKKTHCPQGHAYDAENTYRIPGRGGRDCKRCVMERGRQYRARQRAKEVTDGAAA